MNDPYIDGSYLKKHPTWHVEDAIFKATQIFDILQRNQVPITTVAEIGCGAGGVLRELSRRINNASLFLRGFDISKDAIELAITSPNVTNCRIEYSVGDLLETSEYFDLLLVIDVFEHVPDYLGFISRCKDKATYKVYHIPLDIHVSSVLRGTLTTAREALGHLHYFTRETALASLIDTGHEIIDSCYTGGSLALLVEHFSWKRAIANVPRWLVSRISRPAAARLFGGFSLLVLAK